MYIMKIVNQTFEDLSNNEISNHTNPNQTLPDFQNNSYDQKSNLNGLFLFFFFILLFMFICDLYESLSLIMKEETENEIDNDYLETLQYLETRT